MKPRRAMQAIRTQIKGTTMNLQNTSRFDVAEIEEEAVTAKVVARECLQKADGNWADAAKLMRRRLDEDNDLFRELMSPMLDQAIWSCIRAACHSVRGSYSVAPNADDAAGLGRMATVERLKWLDYPLSGGIKLRDADREKLSEEAEMHEGFARGNAMKAEFLRLIARRVDGKRVGEVLSEQQVTKIAEKVFGRKGS